MIFSTLVRELGQLDLYYKKMTVGFSKSDGVVKFSRQEYPSAIDNYTADDPTSHTGETKHERSAKEIREVMRTRLRVAVRP